MAIYMVISDNHNGEPGLFVLHMTAEGEEQQPRQFIPHIGRITTSTDSHEIAGKVAALIGQPYESVEHDGDSVMVTFGEALPDTCAQCGKELENGEVVTCDTCDRRYQS